MSYRTGCVTILGILITPDFRFTVMNTNFLDIRVNVNMYMISATITMPERPETFGPENFKGNELRTYFRF